jgi:arylsulfatase
MHEFKSGVTHTINPYRNMNRERLLISQLLKAQGYATGHFGKWHLGIEEGYAPHERGFDVSVITRRDDKKEHFNPVFVRNGVPQERRRGYRTDLLFDDAMAFVEDNKTRPFFCYLATHSPHSPKRCPPKYAEPYKERTPKLASFFGMIANIDENVGRLLSKLDELDLARDTLVIFMNDNGGTSGVDLWNAGMRGTKGTPWRGGTRAISFWRLPSRFKPRDVDAMAAHVDLYPTLAELAGATIWDRRIRGPQFQR